MQAVILAAGQSSRFYPYNLNHKSLVKILGKSIIEHTLLSVKRAGIKEIIIIERKDSAIQNEIGNGEMLSLDIKYIKQVQPLGMGEALLRAVKLINNDFFLLSAHHVDFCEFSPLLMDKHQNNKKIVILAKKEENVTKYGVLKIKRDKVLDVIEKPKEGDEPSKLRIISIYLLNKDFIEVLSTIPLNHYHFEKALSVYAKTNDVRVVETNKESISFKYPWDLLALKNYLLKTIIRKISMKAKIAKNAEIIGNVYIEEGVEVMEGVCIKGPAYIGNNSLIGSNVLLRNGVNIEANSKIGAYAEVKNTLVMENSTTHSGFFGDSIIGQNTKIGAMFCTANVRLDRDTVKTVIKNEKVDTQLKYLGTMLGNNVKIGIRVSTMPGVIIGNNTDIGPATVVMENVKKNVSYYTEYKKIITKDKKNKNPVVLFDIDYTLFDTDTFKKSGLMNYKLYKEVQKVIFDLVKIAKLGILSQGQLEFQLSKLKNTKIYKHFSEKDIHIVEDKPRILKEIFLNYNKNSIVLVDDKLPILYEVKNLFPSVFTVWVKRGIYAEKQNLFEDFFPDATIPDLKELPKLIHEQ